MINHCQKIDCRAFVSEKYFRHFSKKTFSAESILLTERLSDKVPQIVRSAPMTGLLLLAKKYSDHSDPS